MPRLHFTKFPLSEGKSLVSARAGHLFICSVAGASFHLRPLEGKTHVHRARYCSHFAAVGSLSMPSATLSRQNRGRWKPFYISTGRAHELPCLRECLAFALRNASPSLYEMPCLRFTKCLAFASENVSPSLYEMLALQRQMFCFRMNNVLRFHNWY